MVKLYNLKDIDNLVEHKKIRKEIADSTESTKRTLIESILSLKTDFENDIKKLREEISGIEPKHGVGISYMKIVNGSLIVGYTNGKKKNLGRINPLEPIKGGGGKSAYSYAVDSGYTGTEQEFSQALVSGGGGGVSLGETSTTAYRGDRGKIAYDHSQTAHLALGETETTAHRGDEGHAAYDHSQSPHAPADANNYVHPANHPPSIITQDASNRFVTDAEKSLWNGKVDTTDSRLSDARTPTFHYHNPSDVNNFADTVRGAVLTGLSLTTNAAITATNTVLEALGLLQKQITDLITTVSGKQATLVSGTNIKTVNGSSILGSGDLSVGGSSTWGGITGTLSNQTDLNTALSGKEPTITKNTAFNKNYGTTATDVKMNGTQAVGSVDAIARIDHVHPTDTSRAASSHTHAQSEITNLTTDLAAKQATLVSGTNIKTINGSSILGSGNLTVSGSGGSWGSITGTLSDQTDLQSELDLKVEQTTANITYYVATTGSDSNDGLSSGTAFLTIQHAIDSIPQIMNHTVIINVAAGTYAESLLIKGLYGKGELQLLGDTVVSTSRTLNDIKIYNCGIYTKIVGFNVATTTTNGIEMTRSLQIDVQYCNIIGTQATYYGLDAGGSSYLYCNYCTISNKARAINARSGAKIYTSNNSGTNNTYALFSNNGCLVAKSGTQPTGTTQEYTASGGTIVSANGLLKRNQSIASQSLTAATATYLNGSNLNFVAGSLSVGTRFRWTFEITKTAAGTAASTCAIYVGTNGTTADTSRCSFTKPAGTAAIDNGYFTVEATVRSIGASCVIAGHMNMTHNLASTGMATIPCVNVTTVGASFDVSTATNIGIVFTSGASDAYTLQLVTAEAFNL